MLKVLCSSVAKCLTATQLEDELLKAYKGGDLNAIKIINDLFKRIGASHLLQKSVSSEEKPILRINTHVCADTIKMLLDDMGERYTLVFSDIIATNSETVNAYAECALRYAMDNGRRYLKSFGFIGQEMRHIIYGGYNVHMCLDLKNTHSMTSFYRQMEFMRTFRYKKEDERAVSGVKRFFKNRKFRASQMCRDRSCCKAKFDSLLVDHMVENVSLAEMLNYHLKHNCTRSYGWFIMPDSIDVRDSGTCMGGTVSFKKLTYDELVECGMHSLLYKDKHCVKCEYPRTPEEKFLVFYNKDGVLFNRVFPFDDYRLLYETSVLKKDGKCFRKEIVKKIGDYALYSLMYDGHYSEEYVIPKLFLPRSDPLYEVWSFRPLKNKITFNYSEFEKVKVHVPVRIVDKTYSFGLTLGTQDFKRSNLQDRLTASYMRVINSSTGAVTTFDPGHSNYEIQIMSDALLTRCMRDRRIRAEVFSNQKELLREFGNADTFFSMLRLSCSMMSSGVINKFKGFIEKMYDTNLLKEYDTELPGMRRLGDYMELNNENAMLDFDDYHFSKSLRKMFPCLRDVMKDSYKLKREEFCEIGWKPSTLVDTRNSFLEQDICDEVIFFEDNMIELNPDVELGEGSRKDLYDKLNVSTDVTVNFLKNIIVEERIDSICDLFKEPVKSEPIVPFKDTLNALRQSVKLLEGNSPYSVNSKYDLYDIHYGDFRVEMPGGFSIGRLVKRPINVTSGYVPLVESMVTKVNNPPANTNTLLALAKRNCNIPILEDVTSSVEIAVGAVENFFNCVMRPGWKKFFEENYQKYPLYHNEGSNADYVNKLAPGKANKIMSKELLDSKLWEYNKFIDHVNMLKSKTKIDLNNGILDEYTVNSTINYHESEVNAISTTLFRQVVTRMKPCMRDNVCFMISKDRVELEEFFYRSLQKRKNKFSTEGYKALEIDFSKFDKSQGERCAMIEMLVYARLGLNRDFLQLWLDSLKQRRTKNYHDMIKLWIEYQRATGAAPTALGNSIVSGVCSTYVVFPDFPENSVQPPCEVMSVLGDDSTIIVEKDFEVPDGVTEKLNAWFNLSAKFDIFDYMYFCSSFIIYIPDKGCKMIPDPKKRLLNFTLISATELDEVYVSLRDSCKAYLEDREYLDKLAVISARRYKIEVGDMCTVIKTIASILMDKDKFTCLYSPHKVTLYG